MVEFNAIYNWKNFHKKSSHLENIPLKYKFNMSEREKAKMTLLKFGLFY